MKKILSLLFVVALMLGVTSSVFAKESKVNSQKVDIYHVSGGSSDNVLLDQPYQGHVTVVDPMGANDIVLHGVIDGLQPNTTYYVWVRNLTGYTGDYLYQYAPLGYFKLTSFVTDEYGHGDYKYHINDSDLPDGTYNLQVALNYGDPIGYTVAATKKNLTVTVKE